MGPKFWDISQLSCALWWSSRRSTLTSLPTLHNLLIKTSFSSVWPDVSNLVEIWGMNSKDINVSHVWKVTWAFSATSAEWSTVGPSQAIADTLSPAHLALISKPYTNTYISTHTKRQTHTGKHFCKDPLKKIPLNSWTSDMTGVNTLALALLVHTPQPCNKSWWVITVQRVQTHTHTHNTF